MSEIKVPLWFRKQLLDGEKVITKSGHFYVTNQRLLRLLNSINNGVIEYNKISNITYEKHGIGQKDNAGFTSAFWFNDYYFMCNNIRY
ncbi:MAG: hypothetical protein JSW06_00580 [Thermoplasmatales archaeon]|nr:MAG: hypothetical protein JSW06_00580 [Thermoplasmatales archaeon]